MERFTKKFVFLLLLCGCFLLTGCNKFSFGIFDASKEEPDTEISSVPEDSQKNENRNKEAVTVSPAEKAPSVTASANILQTTDSIELTVYTVNAEDSNKIPVTARISGENKITPELIVSTVIEALADEGITIGVDKVTEEKDAVIVSFQKDKAPYTNMGSGNEAAILDAIAQSLIDNLTDYSKVIFRVEGKAYVSGVFEMDINDVYMKE